MEFEFSGLTFVDFTPNISFTRPSGETYTWNKLEISDDFYNKFWMSGEGELVDELTPQIIASLRGKKVIVRGTFKLYKGIPKFKVNEIEQVK